MTEMNLDEIRALVSQHTKYAVLEVRYGIPEKNDSPDHAYIVLGLPTLSGQIVNYPIAVSRDPSSDEVLEAVTIANTDMDDMVARGRNTGILPMWG